VSVKALHSETPVRPSLTEAVATEVRAEMARRRVTHSALAAALGRSQMYVTRRTSGEVAMDTTDIADFAENLSVSPRDLLLAAISRCDRDRMAVSAA
jgi:cyanate lyase